MNKTLKHLRIAIAEIFFTLGNKIDAKDRFDLEAEIRRLDPNYDNPKNKINP